MTEQPMLHPVAHARTTPDKPAYVMAATGEVVTYAELDARANRGARLIRSAGLGRGDGVAVLMGNSPRYLEVMWAAERCGVYCTCLSSKLTAGEAEYIVRDAGASMLIAGAGVAGLAGALRPALGDMPLFMCDDVTKGYRSYEEARDAESDAPLDDAETGQIMLYSSGTTGLPKCMVHGAGGTLLQHLKELVLHTDLARESRVFYFTTCGWMMWNWLVSSLAVGATVSCRGTTGCGDRTARSLDSGWAAGASHLGSVATGSQWDGGRE